MNLATVEFGQVLGAVVIGAFLAWLGTKPRVERLEAKVAALYRRDVPPEVQTMLATFWAVAKPVIVAKLPTLEASALQSQIAGDLTHYLAARGVNLTPGQIVGLAGTYLREAQQAHKDVQAATVAQQAAATASAAADKAAAAADAASKARTSAEVHSGIATDAASLAVEAKDTADQHAQTAIAAVAQVREQTGGPTALAATATGTQTAPADAAPAEVPDGPSPAPQVAKAQAVAAGE